MTVRILGNEAANSFVKVKSELGQEVYANTTRLVQPFEEAIEGSSSRTIYTINGERYVVGERSGSGFLSSGARDAERYASKLFRVENLISIAKHAKNGDRFKIVTGVPATHYNDKDILKTIELALKGEHVVAVNGDPISFTVEEVKVMLQPLGTLMHRLYDETGRLREGREAEKSSYKAVVDIGYGTTDLAILDGMTLKKAIGIDKGMIDAYTLLEELIKTEYPKISGIESPLQLEEKLRNSNTLSTGGGTYEVGHLKAKAFEHTAESIIAAINSRGVALSSFEKVLFTGGGVSALADNLATRLAGINATRMKEAQLANAIGFYTYGKMKL